MTADAEPTAPTSGAATSHRSTDANHPPFPTGLELAPFRALRFATTVAGPLEHLTSPPYDVIDAAGVEALEQASSYNVVRLILPRNDDHHGDRYARAASTLRAWSCEGVLVPDVHSGLYVYEQSDPVTGHAQRGLLGALGLTPAEDGIVLPHENTMSGPVADRLALYTAVEADLEPIFLLYAGGGAASRAVASVSSTPAMVDARLPDGLRHRLWQITAPAVLADIAADLRPRTAVIADGHHRYATYLQRQVAAHQAGRGLGPWDRGLTFLVDANAFGPEVHAIHRVLPGLDTADLARQAQTGAQVDDLDGRSVEDGLLELGRAAERGPAFLLVDGDRSRLRLITGPDPEQLEQALPAGRSRAWQALDVSILHFYLIAKLWGLADDVDSVGYEHDVEAALATAARTRGTAVLLNPTPVQAVTRVASAGERMPRKSTLFTPKPRSGLVLRDHRLEH